MRVALEPHPDTPGAAKRSIAVEIAFSGRPRLGLRYRLSGDLSGLAVPEPRPSRRGERLWEGSCFEMFLMRPGEKAYLEFNFSPSSEWAAYAFTGYRTGMREASDRLAPRLRSRRGKSGLTLSAEIAHLPELPWRLGLSAVVKEASGDKSYWALAHPPGPPDFHHPDCFALELPPPADAP